MRNETLKKKIVHNIAQLEARAEPILAEIELQKGLLAQLEAHEAKNLKAAEETLGVSQAVLNAE